MADVGCEVKFYLDPKKVLAGAAPSAAVAAAFGLDASPLKMTAVFLDSPSLEFHTERWNIRFREKKSSLELSFKRRLPVYDGRISDALKAAEAQGFGEQYEAQIEWGLDRQTLSLVKEPKIDGKSLPSLDDARTIVRAERPGRLRRWIADDWSDAVIGRSRLFGPISFARWKGAFGATKEELSLEVWPLTSGTVVEVSFKKNSIAKAAPIRDALRTHLSESGWLIADDVLKTERILTSQS